MLSCDIYGMKKEQFEQKHRNLNIAQSEIDRKWRVLQEAEEMQRLFEALQAKQASATAGGGGGFTPSLFIEIAPNNDFYYTFS